MANFGRDIAALALQSRPQFSGGSSGPGGQVFNLKSKTKPGNADIGYGFGSKFSEAFSKATDPDAQRERALQTRDLLLSMTDSQRNIVIQNPQVQKQLKIYSMYLPTAFADAAKMTGLSEYEGLLTAVPDQFYAQKYQMGETQISATKAETQKTEAVTKTVAGQEGREQALHPLEIEAKKAGITLTKEQIASLHQETGERKETLPARKEAIEAGTAATRASTQTENLLRESRRAALVTDTAATQQATEERTALAPTKFEQAAQDVLKTQAETAYIQSQTKANIDDNIADIVKARSVTIDKKVARALSGAENDFKALDEKAKNMYGIPGASTQITLDSIKIANGVVTNMPLTNTYDPFTGDLVSGVPYIVTDPSVFRLAYKGLIESYDAFRYDFKNMSPDDIDKLYRETTTLFNASFKQAFTFKNVLTPETKEFMVNSMPFDMMKFITYKAIGDTLPAAQKKALEDRLRQVGMFDPADDEKNRMGIFQKMYNFSTQAQE